MFETLRNLGTSRLVTMTGVGVAFIAFFFYLVTRLTTPGMTMLYSELDSADGGRIVAKLDSMGVPYELRGNGSQIMVPSDQVLRLRMSMAQEGLPSGGSMGYELFDRSETLGTSNFVLNIQHLRSLEGELARTIRSISYVHMARVHLVMPRRQLFSRDKQEPSASIFLKMRGGRRLEKSEVLAIQHLVAAAVPQLKPSRISIIDGKGTLLARGREEGATGSAPGIDSDAMKASFETRLSRMIESILERTVGPGKVRAEVSAVMDYDRISTTTESFDPESQVARSTQTVEETATTTDSEPASQSVTVASNLPGAPSPTASQAGAKNATNSNRTEETVNFEISKTTTTHLRESGIIKRLSVAVLIDGIYTDNGNGNRTYKERSTGEIAKLKKLVSSAIGFDAKRGDSLEIINMRFTGTEEDFDEPARALFGFGKNDYIRIAELGILAVVSILVILLVVRPMIKRILDALPEAIASSKKVINESVAAAAAANPALPTQAGAAAIGELAATTQIAGPNLASQTPLVNLDQVAGRVQQTSLKQIGEIVDNHPEEAVNIIRNWMYQGS